MGAQTIIPLSLASSVAIGDSMLMGGDLTIIARSSASTCVVGASLLSGDVVTFTADGAGNAITVTGHTVSAADLNQPFTITGGTNCIVGSYQIIAINIAANKIFLSRQATTGAVT